MYIPLTIHDFAVDYHSHRGHSKVDALQSVPLWRYILNSKVSAIVIVYSTVTINLTFENHQAKQCL